MERRSTVAQAGSLMSAPVLSVLRGMANSWKFLIGAYIVVIVVSSGVFSWLEHRSIGDSIWWSFITSLTIGYGDVTPTTAAGRTLGVVIATIMILIVIPMIIAQIVTHVLHDRNEFTHEEQEALKADINDLRGSLTEVKALLERLTGEHAESRAGPSAATPGRRRLAPEQTPSDEDARPREMTQMADGERARSAPPV
jgi:voltage-gated potassium channel